MESSRSWKKEPLSIFLFFQNNNKDGVLHIAS